jgi:pheromone shutdown protein TraB
MCRASRRSWSNGSSSRSAPTACASSSTRAATTLAQRTRIESLDLKAVIRNRQLVPPLLNLLLMSYQKQLGGQLGVVPGSELLAAAQLAERLGIPVRLCDRDVRITLRRAWGALSLWRKAELIATLLASVFERRSSTRPSCADCASRTC